MNELYNYLSVWYKNARYSGIFLLKTTCKKSKVRYLQKITKFYIQIKKERVLNNISTSLAIWGPFYRNKYQK